MNEQPALLPLTPPPSTEEPLFTEQSASSTVNPIPEPEIHASHDVSDRLSAQLLLSQPDEPPSRFPPNVIDEDVLDQIAHEVSKRLTFTRPPSVTSTHAPLALSSSHPVQDLLRPSRRHPSSSPSSSSRSSSSSSRPSDVGRRKHPFSSGMFTCPFSTTDSRQFSHPQKRMQAKSEERRYLRRELHDFYSEYSTLKYFIDSLPVNIVSSPTKPYAADLFWLQFHAEYLDCLLLDLTHGPWFAWNKLIVDKLTRSFLDFLVRVSPNHAYPDFLDESVRRWMKRNPVGVCLHFGPVPAFLSDAKVTDSSIQPKAGWDSWRNKEDKKQDATASSSAAKPKGPSPILGEKK